ncbi:MAG: CoA transferase [Dehalococcoidia bacterium]|nr:CoA transferase [Dehalococcoidia bacterium]
MLALEGIRILDLSRLGPGPFCTMILGDLGAEVIKIEALTYRGERSRETGLVQSSVEEGREVIYNALDRNKRSIAINLKSDKGLRIFHKLAERADVIVEGYRPGVTKRLGIDYQTIAGMNPQIVYCSISGYGQDGPYRDLIGHDINLIAMCGMLSLIGRRDSLPAIPLNLLADYGGGAMFAAVGILAAIVARGKTDKGQYVDISMGDTVISLLTQSAIDYFRQGTELKGGELALNGGYPYYNVYETKDGKLITIGCLEPWLWDNLCCEVGEEEYIPFCFKLDHLYHPPEGEKWEEVSSYFRQVFLTRTRDEWFDLLRQKNIPVGKVNSLSEAFSDPQVLHRQMVVEVEHPTAGKGNQVGIAIKLSDTPGKIRSLAPTLGEHTEEILTEIGYSKRSIDKLCQEGVIS